MGDAVTSVVTGITGIGSASQQAEKDFQQAWSQAAGGVADEGEQAASSVADAGGQAASSVGSAASSAVGAVTSSLTSWMSAIGAVVGAVAGIVGDIEQAATNEKLASIEHNTRYIQIEAEQWYASGGWQATENTAYMVGSLNDINSHINTMLVTEQVYLPLLGDTVAHLGTLQDAVSDGAASIVAAIQGGAIPSGADGAAAVASASTTYSTSIKSRTDPNPIHYFDFSGANFGQGVNVEMVMSEVVRTLRSAGARI